jgi:cyclopropane-fatty-acyl-phospholipid synthase
MFPGDTTLALSPARSRGSPFRGAVMGRLARLRSGTLLVEDGAGAVRLGEPAADGLSASLVVRDPRFWRRTALGGAVGAAEAYADGDWETDDLTAVIRVLVRNQEALAGMERGLARLRRPADAVFAALRRNTRAGSRRNIAEHYDLGNDFFALMLDPTLTYSCAVFDRPGATLEEASLRKLELMSERLELRPTDHLLEIGSGWGSMALHAASRFGCRVTTTTISRAQWELARARVKAAGLEDRVTVLLSDYRDLSGRFDKIVSIEMIEAIGAEQYDTFFRRCAELLAPGGRLALQAITIADRHFERARREVDFIKRHVFPGSCIPSVTALLAAATRASDLTLRQLEDYGPHYARTLAAWRENLEARAAEVARHTDERFRRLWRFYLCYCEGGFHERHVSAVQMVLARPAEG